MPIWQQVDRKVNTAEARSAGVRASVGKTESDCYQGQPMLVPRSLASACR
jgi:hypothetical protein